MPIETHLPRWDQGRRIESADLNALAEAAEALERQYGDNYLEGSELPRTTPKIMDHRIGVIRADGGEGSASGGGSAPDFDDARYWVEFYVPKYQLKEDERFNVDKDDIDGIKGIVRAVNFAELPTISASFSLPCGGCHLLSPGEVVHCTLWRTRGSSASVWMFEKTPSPVRVKVVDDTGCGVAYYNGKALKRPTADVDKSTDLAAADLGAEGADVIIRNRQEIGSGTDPWLTNAANTNQLYFSGELVYVNADGTPVIEINAAFFKEC